MPAVAQRLTILPGNINNEANRMIEQDDEYKNYKKKLIERIRSIITEEQQDKIEEIYTQIWAPSILQGMLNIYKASIEDFIDEIDDKFIVTHMIKEFIGELQEMTSPRDETEEN